MSDVYYHLCFLYRRWLKVRRVAETPKDVNALFEKFSVKGRMGIPELRRFLTLHQGETNENAEKLAQKIINEYHMNFTTFYKKALSRNGFLRYLLGKLNRPSFKEQNMEAPLANYFWHTGHAYYLYLNIHEDKYYKADIITTIVKALELGVRVIELQLRANSNKDDVDVYHAGLSVSLKKCLKAIGEHAFDASPFPVMIILVDNFDSISDPQTEEELQRKVAERIKKTLGDVVCVPSLDSSPESMQYKIITSGRLPKDMKEDVAEVYKKMIDIRNCWVQTKDHQEFKSETVNKSKDFRDQQAITTNGPNSNSTEVQEGGLGNYLNADPNSFELFRLRENQLENAGNFRKDVVRFTQENLLAVVHSSNDNGICYADYNPFIGWIHGAQIVSYMDDIVLMNKENKDHVVKYFEKYVWIMQGMFRAYGNAGFVKKPKILLDKTNVFDPTAWRPVKNILKVKVYMGTGWHLDFDKEEFDEASPPDFFTAIEIVGVPEDEAREKTTPVVDEWIPVWNEKFEFPLTVPELALLVIKVREFDRNRSHDFGGQTCLPVWELRNGIRSIPLYKKNGKKHRSVRLLVGFQLDGQQLKG